MAIVEAIYDDYAKATFANYELRTRRSESARRRSRANSRTSNEFLSQLALISNVDAEPAVNQAGDTGGGQPLIRSTRPKGLEFHSVFVIWLTDGMFPSTRSLDTRDAIEEERRLVLRRDHPGARRTLPHLSRTCALMPATATCFSARRASSKRSRRRWSRTGTCVGSNRRTPRRTQ